VPEEDLRTFFVVRHIWGKKSCFQHMNSSWSKYLKGQFTETQKRKTLFRLNRQVYKMEMLIKHGTEWRSCV